MVSEKEVEAACEAWREYWSDVIGQYEDNKSPMEGMRRALEAAACVRVEANAGEPVAWRYKLFESDPEWTVTTEKPKGAVVEPLFIHPSEQAVTEVDEKLPCDVQLPGVKLKRGVRLSTLLMAIRKRKDWPEEQTKLPRVRAEDNARVKALADALRGLLKAYENAFDWSAELTPETAEAERIANEVLHALASSKPEQPVASGKVDARIENTDGKKWRVESNDGKWTIQPEGQITADEARALCERILSALTAGKPHPDDEAVDRFAAAMKAKLKWEREERGRHGWNDPSICPESYLARLLIEHLAKGNDGNFEDVANFCMMLHQRGAHPRVLADALTACKPQPSVKVKPLEWVASDDWEYRWTADLYAIEDQGKNWLKDRYWLYYNGQRLGKFGTLDTALFTAQADYDRRILSALTAGGGDE